MPRSYKREPGNRRYNDYPDNSLQNAIDAVQERNMPINKAARVYGVSKGTLMNRIHGKHEKKWGAPTILSNDEEEILEKRLLQCSAYGYPISCLDLRFIVKSYLDMEGRTIEKFSLNMPGEGWCQGFLKRHQNISQRVCNDIKSARGKVGERILKPYHDNLKTELRGIAPSNIFNFDETNLADKTNTTTLLFKKGVKYPDRIINFTKGCVTVMMCGAADGTLLPPFIVYKSDSLYENWTLNGPKGKPCCAQKCCKNGAHFHHTSSGWFDMPTFEKWFVELFVPHAERLPGKKAVIGDNLSSHFSLTVLQVAEERNIKFICLPPNSTHLTQPLDVAFFRPMKAAWKHILLEFKSFHPNKSIVDKLYFPALLKKMLDFPKFNQSIGKNIKSGFMATGIFPQNFEPLLKRLQNENLTTTVQETPGQVHNPNTSLTPSSSSAHAIEKSPSAQPITAAFTKLLEERRFGHDKLRGKRVRGGRGSKVIPGRSITTSTFKDTDIELTDENTFPEDQPGPSYVRKPVKRKLNQVSYLESSDSSFSDIDTGRASIESLSTKTNEDKRLPLHYVHKSPLKKTSNPKLIKKLPKPTEDIPIAVRQKQISMNDLLLVNVAAFHGKRELGSKIYLAQVDQCLGKSSYQVTFYAAGETKTTFTKKEDDISVIQEMDIVKIVRNKFSVNSRNQYVFAEPLGVSA